MGRRVRCFTDNQIVVRIVLVGSMVKDIALDIFLLTSQRNIQLDVNWLPREHNSLADFLSKIIHFDDYPTKFSVTLISSGAHILLIDLLAVIISSCAGLTLDFSSQVRKLLMLFRRTGQWRIIRLLHPPTVLIGRSLSHLRDCKAIETLIVPMRKLVQFWPLLCDDGVHLNSFTRECFFFFCFFSLTEWIYSLGAGPRILCLVPNRSSPGVLHFVLTLLSTFVFPSWFLHNPHGVVFSLSLVEACLMYIILLVSGFSIIYCFSFCLCSPLLVWHLQCIVIRGVSPQVAN